MNINLYKLNRRVGTLSVALTLLLLAACLPPALATDGPNRSVTGPLTFIAEVPAPMVPVTGRVTDEKGNPVPGATVLVKNSQTGTTTDATGKFTINAPNNAILVFSAIGFKGIEVPVGNQSQLTVTMAEADQSLSEVVVTALGIKKEAKRLGYATAIVNPEQVTTNRTVNFINALQGKIAGVNISSLGTGAAGTSKIRIRGQSSFSGQNSPLIVVNGVPIDNTNFGQNNGSTGSDNSVGNRDANYSDGGDGLSSINPDDIEGMTVLKGGTAAALYGSRAKDGAILITTKTKGGSQGIGVIYNSNFTTDHPLDFTDYQYEYGQGEYGVRPTAANSTSGVWSFGGEIHRSNAGSLRWCNGAVPARSQPDQYILPRRIDLDQLGGPLIGYRQRGL